MYSSFVRRRCSNHSDDWLNCSTLVDEGNLVRSEIRSGCFDRFLSSRNQRKPNLKSCVNETLITTNTHRLATMLSRNNVCPLDHIGKPQSMKCLRMFPAGQSLYCITTSSPPGGGATVDSVTGRNRRRSPVSECVCVSLHVRLW